MTNLFRGYVLTKNKRCIEKFKDVDQLKTLEQVEPFKEYAGILAENIILIDVDDEIQADILYKIISALELDTAVYKTTRGKHFYFKNSGVTKNYTGTKLAVGLKADIKCGSRNSYAIVKYNGSVREAEQHPDELCELPKWLFPIKTDVDFTDMDEGDGRNQALYNYILTLQSNDFSVEEARDTIRLINKFILKNPLSDKEIETILRDEAFLKPVFYIGGKFQHHKMGDWLIKQHHVKRINGLLHVYDNGVYVAGEHLLEHFMIEEIAGLKSHDRLEVSKYVNKKLPYENTSLADSQYIAFNNGLYDLKNEVLMPFSPDIVVINKIDWDYNPKAKCPLVDEVLDNLTCKDNSIRALLEEAIGYCFYRRNELGKAFILTGEGSNGKSTYLNMLRWLIGEKNVVALDIKQFKERFKIAELANKLACIGDDIGEAYIDDMSEFKKIVTGESINAERKGKDPFDFAPYVKLLFAANTIPRMRDTSGAALRRLIIIPFNAKFSNDDPDFKPFITHDLKDADVMEYLILLGLQGLKRVLENKCFSESDAVTKMIEEYSIYNDPIKGFLAEGTKIINEPTALVYRDYKRYCEENNFKAVGNSAFSGKIKKILGLDTYKTRAGMVDKKPTQIFIER